MTTQILTTELVATVYLQTTRRRCVRLVVEYDPGTDKMFAWTPDQQLAGRRVLAALARKVADSLARGERSGSFPDRVGPDAYVWNAVER